MAKNLNFLKISINKLGKDHPDVADTYNNIGIVYNNQKKYDDYQLPAAGLLNDPVEISNILSEEELKNKATQLVHALDTFKLSN